MKPETAAFLLALKDVYNDLYNETAFLQLVKQRLDHALMVSNKQQPNNPSDLSVPIDMGHPMRSSSPF